MRVAAGLYRAVALAGVCVAMLLAGCSGPGEDRPGSVSVDPESETISVSGSGTGTGSASGTGSGSMSGTGSASGTGTGPAEVSPEAGGYTPVSNVDAYFAFSLDHQRIKELAAEGNWAEATNIYTNGENASRSDGSLRSIQSLAVSESVLAVFPNGAEVYGDPQFLDAHIQAGLTGTGWGAGLSDAARRQLVDKGIQSVLYAKAIQEIESARGRTAEGNTNNLTGAPHAVDEAAGLYLGATDAEGELAYSLTATARSREGNFGLDGKLDLPLREELTALQQAAQAGASEAFAASEARARGYLHAIFYLATLRYARSAVDAPVADREVPLAEGWAFYQTLRPTVAQASPETARRIDELFRSDPEAVPATMTTEVYDGLNAPEVLEVLGIPPDLVVR